MTDTHIEYVEVPADKVPEGLRWDVPRQNQGQMVEVAYACPGSRAEAGHGDPWQRVVDTSDRSVAYYRRAGGQVVTRRLAYHDSQVRLCRAHDEAKRPRHPLGPVLRTWHQGACDECERDDGPDHGRWALKGSTASLPAWPAWRLEGYSHPLMSPCRLAGTKPRLSLGPGY